MNIYFLIFFPLIIINSFFVIFSKNSVTSVLFLISVFILVSLNLILLGAEFLAILIIIIYIGAISILFLFVIMMLNLRIVEVYNSLVNIFPIGSFIGIFFFFEIIYLIQQDYYLINLLNNNLVELNIISYNLIYSNSNMFIIGDILFNYYNELLIIAGLILLLAMLGSILLTLDKKDKSKYDNFNKDYHIANKSKISFWSIKKKKYI